MKTKFISLARKASTVVASLALLAVTSNVNFTCTFWLHQTKLPENAKKLRKF